MKAAVLIWLASSVMASATTYYVDPVAGSDDNNGTATNTAWAHIPGTIGSSGSGWGPMAGQALIIVKGGSIHYGRVALGSPYWVSLQSVYDWQIIRSGDLAGWGSGRAVFDGGGTNTALFTIGDSGDVLGLTLDGLELRNVAAGAAGTPWDGSTGSAAILPGANDNAYSFKVSRCFIHDIARTVDNTGHGIEFGGYCTNFIIWGNTFSNVGTKCIETVRAKSGVISNNWFDGSLANGSDHMIAMNTSRNVDVCYNVGRFNRAVHEGAAFINIAGSTNCDVWGNVGFHSQPVNLTDIVDYSPAGISETYGGLSNRVVCNTLYGFQFGGGNYGNASCAMSLEAANPGQSVGSLWSHNLVLDCLNSCGAAFTVSTNYTTGEVFKYNLFYNPTNTQQLTWVDTADNLAWCVAVANFPTNWPWATYSNNLQVDPALTGGTMPTGLDSNWRPNTTFFSLTASSPSAVTTTGNALYNKFAVDIAGNTRSAWSMGAYEYVPPAPPGIRFSINGRPITTITNSP